MKLYGFYASSAAYRVRIALNIKNITVETSFVNLTAGEQFADAYARINPQQAIPSLIDDEGNVLTQSLAIIEYLEERFPQPPLLPADPLARARVRAVACAMAEDIAPINNLRVRKHVTANGLDERAWIRHWTQIGLTGVEKMLVGTAGSFCVGSEPTMADCVLIPQLAHARRFGCDLSAYPTLRRIDETCNRLPAFIAALPANQPDAP